VSFESPITPKKTSARILLSSVFGPYAQDDEYGSRKINPMELYENQVPRVQGSFSLRMFHRSFGLSMIQENIDAPCTVLDFPSLERFVQEIKNHFYDIVGIGAIAPNVGKVKKMCQVVRQFLPKARIVIGGHIANKEDLSEIVDADYIVKGEGIRWFRKFLGSSIIGMENHTSKNMDEIIRYAVLHDTVFHQFMLYTAVSGTPLYDQLRQEGKLYSESEFPVADAHGQYRFNYRHPHIQAGQEETYLLDAFKKDFEINGPSLARLIKVLLAGWKKYKISPDKRIRSRFSWEVKPLKTNYAGAVWAMKKWFSGNTPMKKNKAARAL